MSILLSMFLSCSDAENDLLEAPNGIATYNLRDIGPAGGIIVYDKGHYSDGWRYLEAAPYDQSDGAPWGCNGTLIDGSDGTAIGTGMQNTIDILNGCSSTDTVAYICANLSLNGYSDWFLPSLYELRTMTISGLTGNSVYWSSSEYDATRAWYKSTANYYEGYMYSDKNATKRVRAIRAF